MRSITTCVNYSDFLAHTLPYNKQHFEEMWVVTSKDDKRTVEVCRENGVNVIQTNAFYTPWSSFNKFNAIELGLKEMGRDGWLCFLDADVLIPKTVKMAEWTTQGNSPIVPGNLYVPMRRMYLPFDGYKLDPIPDEKAWKVFDLDGRFPWHFSGYCQIFHANDKQLGNPPWHALDLVDCGKGDTLFQNMWPAAQKIRPAWECLHLGPNRVNWKGRKELEVSPTRRS